MNYNIHPTILPYLKSGETFIIEVYKWDHYNNYTPYVYYIKNLIPTWEDYHIYTWRIKLK